MPVTLAYLPWESAGLLSHIAEIIMQDKMGYKVAIAPVPNSKAAWMQIADCNTTDASLPCNPGPKGSGAHFALEAWESSSVGMLEKLTSEVPLRVPIRVSYPRGIGAESTEAMFFQKSTADRAIVESSLFLEWYASYNVSGSHTYFASHTDLPTPDFTCDENIYLEGSWMDFYTAATGDFEAVAIDEHGLKKHKCQNEWALSKACRDLLEQGGTGCIPLISLSGWGYPPFLQLAFWYRMPIAFGSYTFPFYRQVPREYSTMLYWWLPDVTFDPSKITQIVFPTNDADEHSKGIIKTAVAGVRLLKLASTAIVAYPRLMQFVDRLSVSLQTLMGMVETASLNKTRPLFDVACEWVLGNRVIWQPWVPDRTSCVLQQGLLDIQGNFTTNVSLAFGCEFCDVGRHSDSIQTEKGTNYICKSCSPGKYQSSLGKTECSTCSAGTFALEQSSSCSFCAPGSYVEVRGSSECSLCSPSNASVQYPLLTKYPGSTSVSECVCPEGSYSPLGGGPCLRCPKGMLCPFGSSAEFVPLVGTVTGIAGPYPQVEPGFMTLATAPWTVYKCVQLEHCPGGPPGKCADYRDTDAVSCGGCEKYAYEADGRCQECVDTEVVPLILTLIAAIVGIGLMTIAVNRDILRQNNAGVMMVIVSGLTVTTLQTLFVFDSLMVNWFEPLTSIFKVAGLFSFDLKHLKISCSLGVNPVGEYAFRQCVAPLSVPVILSVLLVKNFRFPGTDVFLELINSVGSIYNIFFISIILSAFMPFVCFDHPGDAGSSVLSLPAIQCFQAGEHASLMVVSIVALILVPVPFAAMTGYATYNYPVWMSSYTAKAKLVIKAYRFLFFRFTPQRYYYGVLVLLRSFLICSVPVAFGDDVAIQVCTICAILSTFVMIQQCLAPWRNELCNLIDGGMTTGLSLVLVTGAMSTDIRAQQDSVQLMGTLIFGVVCAMCFGLLAVALYMRLIPRPYYHAFVCHHKADAAAQSRFLKILLQGKYGISVFIDSDDLKELDKLFDTVKTKVGQLIVFLTRDTLSRPWCAGEIVTALRAHVLVTAVKTPSFYPPSEEQMQNLGVYLDMSTCNLLQYHITLDDVAAAFNELLSAATPVVMFRGLVGTLRFHALAEDIRGRSTSKEELQVPAQLIAHSGMVAISTDPHDAEALASTGILVSKIQERVNSIESNGILSFADCEEDMERIRDCVWAARAVVILLSEGTLERLPQVVSIVELMKASETHGHDGPSAISLNIPSFKFPSADYSLSDRGFWRGQQGNAAESTEYVKKFFKRIAIFFAINASDRILDTNATDVFDRISAMSGRKSQKSLSHRSPRTSITRVKCSVTI